MAINTYAISFNYNSGGQFAASIRHYQFDDSGFATSEQAAAALCVAVDGAVRTALLGVLPAAVKVLSYKARSITAAGGFEGPLFLTSANTGTRSGNMQAAGICPVLILYPTANAKQRARFFLPGVSNLDALDGQFTAGYRTAAATLGSALLATPTLSGGGSPVASPVVWSRATRTSRLLEHAQLSDMIGQIRRRQLPV